MMARKLLEGVWLEDTVEAATARRDETKDTLATVKATVQQCSDRELAFVHFVRQATSESLQGFLVLQNCQCLVAAAFESLIDDNDQIVMLRCLSLFAEANASLFVREQLDILESMVCEFREKPFMNAITLSTYYTTDAKSREITASQGPEVSKEIRLQSPSIRYRRVCSLLVDGQFAR